MTKLLLLLSLIGLSNSHPHGFYNYPGFSRELPQQHETPTVNIFKIYAPRQIFLNGYKVPENDLPMFEGRDKQMDRSATIFERILRNDMFPNEEVEDKPYFFSTIQDSFEPKPSNIVSRKMAPYDGPGFPSFNLINQNSVFDNEEVMEPARRFDFYPEFPHMHHEHCDFEDDFHISQPLMNELNDYPEMFPSSDYDDKPTIDLFFQPLPMMTPESSPLANILKSINIAAADPVQSTDDKINPKNYQAEMTTTVFYGAPEFTAFNKMTDQFGDVKPADVVETNQPEGNAAPADVVINRNFIKTILPDNTSVIEEVEGTSEESDENSDEPMEEVEVNVVKTILPDNSYTVSEVITTNEKVQSDVS